MELNNDGVLIANAIQARNTFQLGFYQIASIIQSQGFAATSIVVQQSATLFSSGACYINGNLYVASDERLKTNIKNIDNDYAISIIKALKPKSYEWKDVYKSHVKTAYGLIAQEVKEIFPCACSMNKDFIPNIYEIASDVSSNENTTSFKLEKQVNIGDKIRLHVVDPTLDLLNIDLNNNTIDDGQEIRIECKVLSVDDGVVTVDKPTDSDRIFVYGIEDNVNTVDYTTFIPLLISTCQTLLQKNQQLEQRIVTLEEKLYNQ
jgi:hypothetical protein